MIKVATERPQPASSRAEVLARYDELAALLASVADRPPAAPGLVAEVAPLVVAEARLLDHGRREQWLDWFTGDAVVWVPLRPDAHPARDQSLLLDDRRRLGERVAWHAEPSAWGQHPASVCVRTVGTVEAWSDEDGTVVARSAFTIVEQRHAVVQVLAGWQIHELVGDARRCRSKILVVPQLADGTRNPSFLL